MARAYFRRIGHDASSVNIYMPDRIFEEQTTGKLAKFTYEQKWGLVPNARTFAFLTIRALSLALAFLTDTAQPVFEFSAKKRKPS